jgi:predicted transcriptional regulator
MLSFTAIGGIVLRTLVDIPETDLISLDALAKSKKAPRARLIREAISDYLAKKTIDPIDAGFGAWKDRQEDGLAYQNRLREEW